MGSEDGRYINASLLAKREGYASKPFVELSDDCALLLVVYVLFEC